MPSVLGYQLFGENYKRSVFLIELKKSYREMGLRRISEMPDRLSIVLRFVLQNNDAMTLMHF